MAFTDLGHGILELFSEHAPDALLIEARWSAQWGARQTEYVRDWKARHPENVATHTLKYVAARSAKRAAARAAGGRGPGRPPKRA